MTAPRPRRDNLTASQREPVTVTCNRCGHAWSTRARADVTIRCPACKTGRRVPVLARSQPVAQQASEPVVQAPAPASQALNSEPANMPAHAAAPVPADEPEPEINPDDDYHPHNKTFDAIRRAVYEGQASEVTADGIIIRDIERIIRRIQAEDEPTLRYRVSPANQGMLKLRLWSSTYDDTPQAIVVPAIAETASRVARSVRKRRTTAKRRGSCEYCGAIPGVTTSSLWFVSSPALPVARVLCDRHAAAESSAVGAELMPA